MIAEFKNSMDTLEDVVETVSQNRKEKGQVGKWEKKLKNQLKRANIQL